MYYRTNQIRRSAMTLIEITISIAILGVVSVMTMESLISAQRWRALAEVEDGINTAATKVLDTMAVDLAESGWWFPTPNALSTTTIVDRGLYYFPYVQQQAVGGNTEGQGTRFQDSWRAAADVTPLLTSQFATRPEVLAYLTGAQADASTVFGPANRANYLASYFARSQELFFLKQTSLGWVSRPENRSQPTLSFPDGNWSTATGYDATGMANRLNLGILMPNGWESDGIGGYQQRPYDADGDKAIAATEGLDASGNQIVPYGVPLQASRLNSAGGAIVIEPQWETMAAADYDGSNAQQPFREYYYTVVPSPIGMGRLVRAYSLPTVDSALLSVGTNPGQRLPQTTPVFGAYVVDQILSDDIVRVVFDTYRTDASLLINEVRVRLYLARVSTSDTNQVVRRMVESILVMRAKATPADDAADQILANGPVAFPY